MLQDLPPELITEVAKALPAAEDILRLSRTCKWLHEVVVHQSEEAWHALYLRSFGSEPDRQEGSVTRGQKPVRSWLDVFRDR
jgi:hypothetical protein